MPRTRYRRCRSLAYGSAELGDGANGQARSVGAGSELTQAADVDCPKSFSLKPALGLLLHGIGVGQLFSTVWVNSALAPTHNHKHLAKRAIKFQLEAIVLVNLKKATLTIYKLFLTFLYKI